MAAVVWECSNHTWKVLVPNVSGCPGGSDCGLFVLAFAYTLCAGAVPEKMTYNQSELMSHFLCCLTRKSSCKTITKKTCTCRLPDIWDGMVKYHPCLERFHQPCIQADKTFYPPSGTVLHVLRNKLRNQANCVLIYCCELRTFVILFVCNLYYSGGWLFI